MRAFFSFCLLLVGLVLAAPVWAAGGFDPDRAAFPVRIGEMRISYREFGYSVMPGDKVAIAVASEHRARGVYRLTVDGTLVTEQAPGEWRWTAQTRPGLQRLEISRDDGRSLRLNVFVMRPASEVKNGYLNGYRIGEYPATPLRGNPIYLPPRGFIEVTREMVDVRVSPHFTLGQFLCKQQPNHWPKYVLVRPELAFQLEQILEEVNRRGIRTATFQVMSGYRTPWYNASIGNGRYSRHLWGGAADIFIDTTGDGRMDDLVGDGRSGLADAKLLRSIIEELDGRPDFRRLPGGLGLYGPRPHRGPFVHVDVRGHPAYWELP